MVLRSFFMKGGKLWSDSVIYTLKLTAEGNQIIFRLSFSISVFGETYIDEFKGHERKGSG